MATLNSSTPRTWTSSETVTAAMLNEELSSNFNATIAYLGMDYKSDTTSTAFNIALPAYIGSTVHKHVRIVGQIKTESTVSANLRGFFNAITSTVYAFSRLWGVANISTGTQEQYSVNSSAGVFAVTDPGTAGANSFASFDITIANVHSTAWKCWISESGRLLSTASGGVTPYLTGGVCASTISTATVLVLTAGMPGSGLTFSSGSRASLYWIP